MKNRHSEPLTLVLLISVCLLSSTTAQADPLRLIELAPGKRVWMNPSEITALIEEHHDEGICGGFFDVTDFPELPQGNPAQASLSTPPPIQQQPLVNRLIPDLSTARLVQTVTDLSAFPTRHYKSASGVQSADWIKKRFESESKNRTDVSVSLFKHSFVQPSVIARIEGSNPALSNQVVLIGAHQDSISRGSTAPGADDDATGMATILEIFHVLMTADFVPQHPVEFIAFAGEEGGLLGSQDIARSYQQSGRQVTGMLQFDMTMYPGQEPEISFITDYTDPNLTDFLRTLTDTYVQVKWRNTACGYGCSDHASFNRQGFPAAFPFESDMTTHNSDIHSPADTLDKLNTGFGLHYAKLGLAFAVELGLSN